MRKFHLGQTIFYRVQAPPSAKPKVQGSSKAAASWYGDMGRQLLFWPLVSTKLIGLFDLLKINIFRYKTVGKYYLLRNTCNG
jgi:hypothetical protein